MESLVNSIQGLSGRKPICMTTKSTVVNFGRTSQSPAQLDAPRLEERGSVATDRIVLPVPRYFVPEHDIPRETAQ